MEKSKQEILELVPAIRALLSGNSLKSGSFVPLDQMLVTDPEDVSVRLGRDIHVVDSQSGNLFEKLQTALKEIGEYIFIQDMGLLGLADNKSKIEQKIATVRKQGRGASLPEAVAAPQFRKPLYNKIVAVTGAAMGYGEGIARQLFSEGANLVLMDVKEEAGKALMNDLNRSICANRASFVKCDVTDLSSMEEAIYQTVLEFAGLDVMISNAGVLKAGGIEEMQEEDFDFVTSVNYKGFFNCVKAVVPVLRQQNKYHPDSFGDIIQINSKSGIEGSKKNFAYAGSKFGGIGLTQSFALELMPERIKVNAICPGNFFEGPLWSDPEKGLFKQYLETGKVPGARTLQDVRNYYESMVPAGRGCRVEDVVKAINYIIDQEYETGQAIMVTGGQVMLN